MYDNPRNLENADANNLAAFLPQIEKFQVKSVRVYPVYQKPGDTEDYYDSNIYVKHNISGNDWGQNNFLEVCRKPQKDFFIALMNKDIRL